MNRSFRTHALRGACVSFAILLGTGCSENNSGSSASSLSTHRERVPLPTSPTASSAPARQMGIPLVPSAREPASPYAEPKRIAVVTAPSNLSESPAGKMRLASGPKQFDGDEVGPISPEEAALIQQQRDVPNFQIKRPANSPRPVLQVAPPQPLNLIPPTTPKTEPDTRYPTTNESRAPIMSWQQSRASNYDLEAKSSRNTVDVQQAPAPTLPRRAVAPLSGQPSEFQAESAALRQQDHNPDALRAVSQQCEELLAHAKGLAQRGALFSAKADVAQALRLITQALDAQSGTNQHSQALAAAHLALQEADDFTTAGNEAGAEVNVARVTEAHQSAVLRPGEAEQLSTVAAIQQYYNYAERQLSLAGGRLPVASQAYYWQGKIHAAMTDVNPAGRSQQNALAMVYHQAALDIDDRNHLAANELGVLLARFGQLEQAKQLLIHSVATRSHADGWHNLAVIHSRLGENELARKANYERQLAQRSTVGGSSTNGDAIRWLDPGTFAAQSRPGEIPNVSRTAQGSAGNNFNTGATTTRR